MTMSKGAWPPMDADPEESSLRTRHMASTVESRGTQYRDISAGGSARQHNGNVYNQNSYHYTLRERRYDETLREDRRSEVLLKAAAEGQTPRVKRLLKLGADIDYADKQNGYTALHHAVYSGFEDIVEALLEEGADVNSQSNSEGTPIHLAALKGRSNITNLLLRYRANVHIMGAGVGQPLHCAVFYGDANICLGLLERGAGIDSAAQLHYGSMQLLSLSAQDLAHVDEVFDCHPIDVAIDRDNLAVVELLVKKGASPTLPCQSWSPPMLRGRTVDPSKKLGTLSGVRPIHRAACLSFFKIMSVLNNHGASLRMEDNHGMNPIMYAAFAGSVSCMRLLIHTLRNEHPVLSDVSAAEYITKTSNDGFSALDLAVHWSREDCIRMLCESVPCMEGSPLWGPYPLRLACELGNLEVLAFLLEHGFDANLDLQNGYTPVLQAAYGCTVPTKDAIILALAHSGAKLSANTIYGKNLAQKIFENSSSIEDHRPLFAWILRRLYGRGENSMSRLFPSKFSQVLQNLTAIRERVDTSDVDRAMLYEAMRGKDVASTEVLAALGASRGKDILSMASHLKATGFIELYGQACKHRELYYQIGGSIIHYPMLCGSYATRDQYVRQAS